MRPHGALTEPRNGAAVKALSPQLVMTIDSLPRSPPEPAVGHLMRLRSFRGDSPDEAARGYLVCDGELPVGTTSAWHRPDLSGR